MARENDRSALSLERNTSVLTCVCLVCVQLYVNRVNTVIVWPFSWQLCCSYGVQCRMINIVLIVFMCMYACMCACTSVSVCECVAVLGLLSLLLFLFFPSPPLAIFVDLFIACIPARACVHCASLFYSYYWCVCLFMCLLMGLCVSVSVCVCLLSVCT